MLAVKNLSKRYGTKVALEDVSFTLDKGHVVGFVGPNGAGKSTAMNIITGYLAPSQGSVTIDDITLEDDTISYKKCIGYLPEKPPLYMDMTVMEYLNFVFELKNVDKDREEEIREILEMTNIFHVRGRLIRNLSKGYKQRVGLAQALIGRPPLIILDEPTIGLDPSQIIEFRNLLYDLKKDHTIIFSSHILSEITEICDKILLINEGKIIAYDVLQELYKGVSNGTKTYTIKTAGAKKDIQKAISEVDGVIECSFMESADKKTHMLSIKSEYEYLVSDKVAACLVKKDFPVYSIQEIEPTLEDVFIYLTKHQTTTARR